MCAFINTSPPGVRRVRRRRVIRRRRRHVLRRHADSRANTERNPQGGAYMLRNRQPSVRSFRDDWLDSTHVTLVMIGLHASDFVTIGALALRRGGRRAPRHLILLVATHQTRRRHPPDPPRQPPARARVPTQRPRAVHDRRRLAFSASPHISSATGWCARRRATHFHCSGTSPTGDHRLETCT